MRKETGKLVKRNCYFVIYEVKGNRGTEVSFLLSFAINEQQAKMKVENFIGLRDFGYPNYKILKKISPQDLHPYIHAGFRKEFSFDGFVSRLTENFGNLNVQDLFEWSFEDWCSFLTSERHTDYDYLNSFKSINLKLSEGKDLYCVFNVYENEDDRLVYFDVAFPYATDHGNAIYKARTYFDGLRHKGKTRSVGPINIYELPYYILLHDIIIKPGFDGFISAQNSLYFDLSDDELHFSYKDILHELTRDWVNPLDL